MGVARRKRGGGERDGTARWRLRDRVPSFPHANLTRHQISEADKQAGRGTAATQNNDTHSFSGGEVGFGYVGGIVTGANYYCPLSPLSLSSPKKPRLSRRDCGCGRGKEETKREGKSGIEMLLDEATTMRHEGGRADLACPSRIWKSHFLILHRPRCGRPQRGRQ